jgi:hypothetical protein
MHSQLHLCYIYNALINHGFERLCTDHHVLVVGRAKGVGKGMAVIMAGSGAYSG